MKKCILPLLTTLILTSCGGSGGGSGSSSDTTPFDMVNLSYDAQTAAPNRYNLEWSASNLASDSIEYTIMLKPRTNDEGVTVADWSPRELVKVTDTTSTELSLPLHLALKGSLYVEACVAGEPSKCETTESSLNPDDQDVQSSIAYLKASNTDMNDNFSYSVSISSDGNTLAVSAPYEDSSATGIGGNQDSDATSESGAVYVFTRSGGTWSQQAYIKASNTETNDNFGYSISLSSDGNTLAVGAPYEDSNATGVGGDDADNSTANSGAVYVFTRSGGTWGQHAYIKASNNGSNDHFGSAVSLSSDGSTLAVGSDAEDSNATGLNGDQTNNTLNNSGAVYVFRNSSGTWSQEAYVKASNPGIGDNFGFSISLSSDGDTLAVGAPYEDSSATGVGGNTSDNSAEDSGAVYVFTYSGSSWGQQAYIKASNTGDYDDFGYAISLSSDGNTLAVGADYEGSNATGINGNQNNEDAMSSGAAYVFTRSGSTWSQQAYIKASNTAADDNFGGALSLSADGNTLAVGAPYEDSNATDLAGDDLDNSVADSGAIYLFTRSGTTWSQQTYLKASNTGIEDWFGFSLSISGDGNSLAVGAVNENSNATGVEGDESDATALGSGAVFIY